MAENPEQPNNQTDLGWPLSHVTQQTLRRWLAMALGEESLINAINNAVPPQGNVVVALTDGSSVATDASLGDVFTLTTTQNFTMSNPTNAVNGKIIIYQIRQDGGGSNVITWGSNFRGSTDVILPVLTTTGGYADYIMFIYDSSVTKWNCLATNLGFAS